MGSLRKRDRSRSCLAETWLHLLADSGNNRVRKVTINQSLLPYITPTPVGTSDSTDGGRLVTISNNGNAPLVFQAPAVGTNPAISSSFSYDGASTCPLLSPGSYNYTLAAGASCNYVVDFAPAAGGTITGTLMLTTDNLKTPVESITFPGNGLAGASSTSLTTSTSVATSATSVTLTATVYGAGSTPSGNVSFTSTSSTGIVVSLGTATMVNGVASRTGTLPLGFDTITATYDGSSSYATSTSNDVTVSVSGVVRPPPVCPQSAPLVLPPPICPPIN